MKDLKKVIAGQQNNCTINKTNYNKLIGSIMNGSVKLDIQSSEQLRDFKNDLMFYGNAKALLINNLGKFSFRYWGESEMTKREMINLLLKDYEIIQYFNKTELMKMHKIEIETIFNNQRAKKEGVK